MVDITHLTDQPKFKYLKRKNEMIPELQGVCTNLVPFPWISSPTRMYMVGNMIPKAVDINGRKGRKIVTGAEFHYADGARCIKAPSNMIIEGVFYVRTCTQSGEPTDKWNSMWLVFKNDELNAYDVLELPRYNTQNTYIGFEYVYDKEVMRKIDVGARFPKDTVFAKSPRVSDSGEWMFGTDLKVCPGSFHFTEEDGIAITDECAYEKLRCMFKHTRGYQWNEDEYVPLMLYGTDDNPKPFPESGERIRSDGIVMGFRRRDPKSALTTLTKKALRTPDLNFDILFKAPIDSEVMSVEVLSERMKNQANNRSTDHIEQTHNRTLDRYEKRQNEMANEVSRWYYGKLAKNNGQDIPVSRKLDTFLRAGMANITRNALGKVNTTFRGIKRQRLKDWNVTILLREMVPGKNKFKVAGMNGDKGVIIRIIPKAMAPRYADGTTADIIVNNFPAFRRQIFSMLMEQSINFINVNVHKEVVACRNAGDYHGAFAKLLKFFDTGFPEFGELVRDTIVEPEVIADYVNYVAKTQISVQVRVDTKLYGVAIIRALREVYSYKPEKIFWTDSLGEEVQSDNPVTLTNQHFILLDKFGTDMSAQSLPLSNIFGMPAKPSETNKYGSWLQNKHNRNKGEDEARLSLSQVGGAETVKQLVMGNSPELKVRMTRRILRADDVWDIDRIVKPSEYDMNVSLQMSMGMMSDSGWCLREEIASDRSADHESVEYFQNMDTDPLLKNMLKQEQNQ